MKLAFDAAVLERTGEPPRIDRIRLDSFGADDVLLRVAASGLCHSDLELIDGRLRGTPLPCVIGHEAAGVVEAVGPDVTTVAVGDHVVCSWNPHCGRCWYCTRRLPILCERFVAQRSRGGLMDGRTRYSRDGRPVHHFSFVSAHAEYAVVPESAAIPIPREMPLDRACLIGCGVMMGVGAATRVARVQPGSSVAVIGCSVDGLNAIQGAVMAGAECVIASDDSASLLAVARRLGAAVTVGDDPAAAIAAVKAHTQGRGADYVFEAAGTPASFRLAAEVARPGGDIVLLGKVDVEDEVTFRWGSLMRERRLVRTSNGGAQARDLFPVLARAYLDGRLELDALISRRLPLSRINEGYDAMRQGERLRMVLVR